MLINNIELADLLPYYSQYQIQLLLVYEFGNAICFTALNECNPILFKSVHCNMICPLLIKRLGGVGVQYSVGKRREYLAQHICCFQALKKKETFSTGHNTVYVC